MVSWQLVVDEQPGHIVLQNKEIIHCARYQFLSVLVVLVTGKKEPVAENPVSKMPESNQSHDFNLYIGMLVVEMAAVVLIMIASIRCGFPYTQVNGNGVIFARKCKLKITTLLRTLVTSLYRLIWCVTSFLRLRKKSFLLAVPFSTCSQHSDLNSMIVI